MRQLVALLRTGAYVQLASQAKSYTQRWPKAVWSWHLQGLGLLNMGRFKEARTSLERAARLEPRAPDILEHLGIAQLQSGLKSEALKTFEACLKLDANRIAALINAASLSVGIAAYSEAKRFCERALALDGKQAEAHYNLGMALRGLGQGEAAITALLNAAQLADSSAPAQSDIGLCLFEMKEVTKAEQCFRRALLLDPNNVHALSNLGRLQGSQGRIQEALESFSLAARLAPDLAEVQSNLAGALNTLKQFLPGEVASRKALSVNPNLVSAWINLGNALAGMHKFHEAEHCFRAVLKQSPNNNDACNNLGNMLEQQGRFAEAEACFRAVSDGRSLTLAKSIYCAAQQYNWERREADLSALLECIEEEGDDANVELFSLLALNLPDSAGLQRRMAELTARNHVLRNLPALEPICDPAARPARDRMHVGYLSADIHDHATMHLLAGVLAGHDHQKFKIHIYSYGIASEDPYRQLAVREADVFRDVGGLGDADVAQTILQDGIDILVDLKGHTQNTRLGITALRPAPIIVSWLGYPGTLGEPRLADYIIGDPVVTPPEHATHFSERIVCMPNCYQPNDRNRLIGSVPTRQEIGLPEEAFVFCCFNQAYKLNPETADAWAKILVGVPVGVLWLLSAGDVADAALRREFEKRGVAASRLIFAPRLRLPEHLGRLQQADLALDTFPYGSHTTASDALWVGVPLVTKRGETFASRVPASLLTAVGLQDLVAEDWEGYCELVIAMANDSRKYAELKSRLAANRHTHPLFDTGLFVRDLERLYTQIWAKA